jgi:murein DD-endopeptidase MepM/ murein hydrolase activator NlpD
MSRFSGVLWPIEVPRVTLPFSATWTQWYSPERPHRGVDIAPWPGSTGRPVRSPIHGEVAFVRSGTNAGLDLAITGSVPYKWGANDLQGRYVQFDAHEPFHVRMCHHSEILVEPDQLVAAGDIIARIGNTGVQSSGPHVHLEIRKGHFDDWLVVDPLHFFYAAIPGLKQSMKMA